MGISGCGLRLPSVDNLEGGEGNVAGYGGLSGLMGRVLGGATGTVASASLSSECVDLELLEQMFSITHWFACFYYQQCISLIARK